MVLGEVVSDYNDALQKHLLKSPHMHCKNIDPTNLPLEEYCHEVNGPPKKLVPRTNFFEVLGPPRTNYF